MIVHPVETGTQSLGHLLPLARHYMVPPQKKKIQLFRFVKAPRATFFLFLLHDFFSFVILVQTKRLQTVYNLLRKPI